MKDESREQSCPKYQVMMIALSPSAWGHVKRRARGGHKKRHLLLWIFNVPLGLGH
jgi:hypothetical protein